MVQLDLAFVADITDNCNDCGVEIDDGNHGNYSRSGLCVNCEESVAGAYDEELMMRENWERMQETAGPCRDQMEDFV